MQKKKSEKENPNKIPKRDADTYLEMDGIRLPVWIGSEQVFVVVTLSNGMEIVTTTIFNFKDKETKLFLIDEIRKSIADLKIEGLALAEIQKKNYYE